MDWNLFWTAFGAIGGTLGAAATAAAVIVALWQTKYANKKKLKVEFSDDIVVIPSQGDVSRKREYVGVTVTNIGNRRIKVCNWQVCFQDGHGALIVQDTSPIGKMIAPPWPMLLEPEEQTHQYWEKRFFYAFIRDEVPKCKKKNSYLTWIIKDSSDKIYKVNSKKTITEYFIEAEDYYHANT
jgi:hypothetical protein